MSDETAATLPSAPPGGASEPAPATVGRYELRTRLGAGAMGEVWAAHDPQLERDVAIKLVHPRLARNRDVSARMVRESRAMAKLSHRSVIAIYDAGEADGELFLAMELVRGTTLGAMLRDRTAEQRKDWRRWLAMMLDAGHGLRAAHAAGVLHRDFKPDNVLVATDGRVCVGDFGLANLDGVAAARASRPVLPADLAPDLTSLTMTGSLLGTPAYMSLEQLRGEHVDARADQFAFCVATWEALYGERPFALPSGITSEGSLVALLDAVERCVLRPVPAGSEVPEVVRTALVRGLQPDPAARWPALGSLLAVLERAIAPRRWPRYVLAGVGLAAVAALVALAIGGRAQAPVKPRAHQLLTAPSQATYALSPGGRLAIGTSTLEVRELDGTGHWEVPAGSYDTDWVSQVSFDGDDTLYAGMRRDRTAVRWHVGAPAVETLKTPDGRWVERLAEGQLVEREEPAGSKTFVLAQVADDGHVVTSWPREGTKLDLFALSPSRSRFVYLVDENRFHGHFVMIDTHTGTVTKSDSIWTPTAIEWRDDDTLMYASYDETSTIREVAVAPDGSLGEAHERYELPGPDAPMVGRMMVSPDRTLFVSNRPVTRVRVGGASSAQARDFEGATMSAQLGWTADGELVTWNRGTHALELRSASGASTRKLSVALPHEPVNATFADGVLIATLRGARGRSVLAVPLVSGATWSHAAGETFAVRCAGDSAPPCFAARPVPGPVETYAIVALDPATGTTSGDPIFQGPLEDFAVSADGAHFLVCGQSPVVRELDRQGHEVATYHLPFSTLRSVAFDATGGFVAAGTRAGNVYGAGTYGTSFTMTHQSDGEMMLLARASPATGQLAVVGRQTIAEIWQLDD